MILLQIHKLQKKSAECSHIIYRDHYSSAFDKAKLDRMYGTTMKPTVAAGFRSNIICFLSSLDITFRRCGFGFGLEIPLGFPRVFESAFLPPCPDPKQSQAWYDIRKFYIVFDFQKTKTYFIYFTLYDTSQQDIQHEPLMTWHILVCFNSLFYVFSRYAYILYSSTLAPVRPTKINDYLEEA